jgi:RHS repeat-associated protein
MLSNDVVQCNEYYALGLSTSSSWAREGSKNNFLYNAGNKLNAASGWYDMFYRNYDPALGRMMQVDPYASLYPSLNPYNYALNNPVTINDPTGGKAYDSMNESWRHPSWGSQRTGYGSGNHWSEGMQYDGWSLDGASGSGGHFGTFEYRFFYKDGVEAQWKMFRKREWVSDPNQEEFNQLFKQFRNKFFGKAIADIEAMGRTFDWGIVFGEDEGSINSRTPGGTAEGSRGQLVIRIHSSVFASGPNWAKHLALVLGHELVHARDIANGNVDMWRFENAELDPDEQERIVELIMEVHAWEWTEKAERDPRIDTVYGDGASVWLARLRPQLPPAFNFKDYKR